MRLLTGRPDQRAVEDFVRMERWIFDSPPQAAVALAQFVRWFYQENAFVRGTLRLNGRPVELARVRQPLLNLYARDDHIVPPAACAALERHVGSRDYTGCEVATGHIGMYVSRAARTEIPQRIVGWLRERTPAGARARGRLVAARGVHDREQRFARHVAAQVLRDERRALLRLPSRYRPRRAA